MDWGANWLLPRLVIPPSINSRLYRSIPLSGSTRTNNKAAVRILRHPPHVTHGHQKCACRRNLTQKKTFCVGQFAT